MSFFLLKIILALFFLATAVTAVTSMLTMMGKAEKKASPKTLRKIHIVSGRIFLLLLLPLLFLGMRYWAQMGEQASIRAVFHAVLAWGLITLFLIKVVVVKFFKQFLRFAPVLGLLVLGFVLVVFGISAGYYSVKALIAVPAPPEEIQPASSNTVGDAEKGASFYSANCLSCHYTDTEDKKVGPGLKDLFNREKLPFSGRPATVENIKQQLLRPELVMPSFTKMTEQEMADLIAHLKTL
jgi:mono/diheme cytochrome c family protein